jgi:8-oxo-dGTP diphosphatase
METPLSVGFAGVVPYILLPMTQVAVGVIRRNGKILICQRKKGSRYGLKWEFPGGKLEPGESTLDCLKRELREELSIQIEGCSKAETQTAFYEDGGTFEVTYCFVDEYSGEPRNNVFEDVRWVFLDELRALDILEGNKPFVASLTRR